MDRRSVVKATLAALVAFPATINAQPSRARPRIGFLNNLNPSVASASTEAFLRGLRDLGWIDGTNIAIEYRWADGDLTRHTALAAELVRLPVALIVTAGTRAVRALQSATTTIPIVAAIMPDPVALGFVASLARPGGNLTGLANLFEDLTPKQMQILREVLPKATRVALLSDPQMGDRGIQSVTEAAARSLGLAPQIFDVRQASDLRSVFKTVKHERSDGVIILPSPFFNRYRARIAELASIEKLPTFSESSEYVKDGGLLSYGPNFARMYYRAATYVDRILKGEKPGDLSIERPTEFELAVNLKTAAILQLTVPQSLLVRADKVVQ
jgi:putative ABC transport system substrate-binding protein